MQIPLPPAPPATGALVKKETIMGFKIEYHTINADATDKQIFNLAKYAYDPQETSSYHGNLTIHRNKTYDSREEAEKAIKRLDTGFCSDHAVLFYQHEQGKPTAQMKSISDQIVKLNQRYNEYLKNHDVKNFKASFIGCPKCQSKIAKSYIKNSICPVCFSSFKSTSTIEEEKKMSARIRELQQKYHDLSEANNKKMPAKKMFLVKIEWHC